MKNLILIIIGSTFFLNVSAQCRVGYSLNEVYNEYKQEYKTDTVTLGGSPFLKITLSESVIYHLFNEEGRCFLTLIRPLSDKKMQNLVDKYDKLYKRIYKDFWIAKLEGESVKIEKKVFNEIGSCFAFTSL